ncbi:MAG: hypothetical protein GY913_07915 [Proteobacteria bacterium]|nr:hypothetical protein [Pseudomonadota bacterium]MCP4916838.1 hypothetical protein [Pseudomonadota bacterium]
MLPILLIAACGEKNTEPAPPPVGWHAEEGWSAPCYFPPDFDKLESAEGVSARRLARQAALEGMKSQWLGERDDGVSFSPGTVEDIETVLLGRPEQIEVVSRKNLEMCKPAMTGGSDDSWNDWLRGLPGALTEGECMLPFTYTMFDYLDIGAGWHMSLPVCAGDLVVIKATSGDKYRVSESGDWINAEGVPGTSGVASGLPCDLELCGEGMLVGRFTSDDGHEDMFPIGTGTTYKPTANGTISVTINDTTYYDNAWYKSGGITDRTGVTFSPGQ